VTGGWPARVVCLVLWTALCWWALWRSCSVQLDDVDTGVRVLQGGLICLMYAAGATLFVIGQRRDP